MHGFSEGCMAVIPKSETKSPGGDAGAGRLLTRPELAGALQVSVCTLDRMVANGDVPCVRLGGRVRFYLPDVVEALRKGNRKFGRAAELTAESAKIAERGQAS